MTRGFPASGRKKRTVFLSDEAWRKTKAIGGGNASAGIEQAIDDAPMPEGKAPGKPPVRRDGISDH